jgi:primosomal protein N' (replication factor Y) (superfamily II helicase)
VTGVDGEPTALVEPVGNPPVGSAGEVPVARVAVDTPLAHLDREFDYLVPAELADVAVPGARVRVRFAGRLVGGFVLNRVAASTHGRLSYLGKVVSPEPVLSPEVARLARAVADRYAGTLADVLRLAVPPRHARVEKEAPAGPSAGGPAVGPPEPGEWLRYPDGPSFLAALAAGGAPRAVWWALPGPSWPGLLAAAAQAAYAGGRGALVVVPDARDLDRVAAALGVAVGPAAVVTLSADLGPAERYRRFLAVLRGRARVVVGTRAAIFAPVMDLGLVAVWDDGDDLHAEPRAPYPHVRDIAVLRSRQSGAGLLIGGFSPSVDAEALVRVGWARAVRAPRDAVRAAAPRVEATGSDRELARDPAARAARLPSLAWDVARAALAAGAPVLIQVPRRGYQPSLACAGCRRPARCARCSGPLGRSGGARPPACRWCGRPHADWRCPHCASAELRASAVGDLRTAEELGRAFPGAVVRTSGRDEVLATVPAGPALVVATPGAEPVADGGYGAVLLLDAHVPLGRPDLRAGEEAVRRWCAAAALARPAGAGGRVVITGDGSLAAVQALVRWDPGGFVRREADERAALGFPPATRIAALEGRPDAIAALLAAADLPAGADLLGPVPVPPRRAGARPTANAGGPAEDEQAERVLVRVPRESGAGLAAALKAASGVAAARKAPVVRVRLDPPELL